jgi:hypothetical protein
MKQYRSTAITETAEQPRTAWEAAQHPVSVCFKSNLVVVAPCTFCIIEVGARVPGDNDHAVLREPPIANPLQMSSTIKCGAN